jgi:predicted SnoaL-like aldol condensation-catalyzing enzyme
MKNIKTPLILLLIVITGTMNAQKKNNQKMDNKTIVTTFLNGFNDPTKIAQSLDLLSEDYKFKNPMVQLNSKVEFIGLAKEIGAVLTGVEILNITENEDWVTVLYNFKSSIPGIESNIATEWFNVANGKITESLLIYDASEWRKIYAQMEKQ